MDDSRWIMITLANDLIKLKGVYNLDISRFLLLVPNKIPLLGSIHVRSQLPLDVSVILLQSTLSDLE